MQWPHGPEQAQHHAIYTPQNLIVASLFSLPSLWAHFGTIADCLLFLVPRKCKLLAMQQAFPSQAPNLARLVKMFAPVGFDTWSSRLAMGSL